ncbi:MAG TPA: 7TM diverse intracellular signaling domain-containing protein [Cytophaga sp.]|nr:7TM diverse intracellular signaling domain-containing protein [Cytophaga sp.]
MNRSFASYAFNEYYALGAFYGILLIIFLFNVIFYFSLKEKIYFFYACYILSWAWSSMIDDGTGYQYLWPNHYVFTDIGIRSSKLFLLMFFLLYVHYFFSNLKTNLFSKTTFLVSIGLYVIVFISSQFLNIHPFIQFVFFLLPFILVQMSAVDFYRQEYKPARFFILGNFFVIAGFIIRAIMDLNVFSLPEPLGIVFNYSRNIGVLFDIGMLFIALGDRFKFLKQQKEFAQQKVIEQLQENELLTQKVNRELEEKVQQRTKSLSEKTEELNVLNKKLEDQAAEISRWNILLDKDNHLLKQKG